LLQSLTVVSRAVYVACSPAQAAAAPALMSDQSTGSAMLAAQYDRYVGRNTAQEHQAVSQLAHSPRVVCEQLRPDTQVRAVSLVILYCVTLVITSGENQIATNSHVCGDIHEPKEVANCRRAC